MMAELAALALACAPNVHPTTLDALLRHESRLQPYAIGVNKGTRLERQPRTLIEAVAQARTLIAEGVDFDAGLGQINVRNWAWLNLTPETVFEPCTNLQAAQTVLSDCYTRALKQHRGQQQALHAALSCYNTGNFERGLTNGYVGKVLAQANIKIPALRPAENDPATGQWQAESSATNPTPTDETGNKPPTEQLGDRDGFVTNPTPDGFTQPSSRGSAPPVS